AEMLRSDLRNETFAPARALSDLETVIKAGKQGAQAIKRIQDYTRIRKDQPSSPVDLNAAVRDAIEITKPKWKQDPESKGIRIGLHLELTEVGPVLGNLLELAQVVENLIFNAVEAMPKGGSIKFRSFKDAESVILEVSDTGVGMSEETQRRLFEPFFTTKESGQGLGTSIVYGIVARHNGRIAVDSRPGSGTTFRISLPAHVARVEESHRPIAAAPAAPRSARILLVDDEEAVRAAYQAAIVSAGHDVTPAASGQQAVAHLESAKFDLVITDLSMSGMSGYQVSSAVKLIDPSIRVILLSGWAVDPRSEQVRRSGIDEVLSKPCPIEELREAIQRALGARPEERN
ncbi:MAG TPA: ATP-binding protein, partial [Candidatus Polarisedimenticolia bacterium]|nr:ATP-binding protein [Candidatus Polarisedimenticolia bacterium]